MKHPLIAIIAVILTNIAVANTSTDPKELGTHITRAGTNVNLTILCSDMFDSDVLTIEIQDAPEGSTLTDAAIYDYQPDPNCLGVYYSSEFDWASVGVGEYWLMIVVTDLAGMTDYGVFVVIVEPDPDINQDGVVDLQDFDLFARDPEALIGIDRFVRYWLARQIVP